MSNYVTLTLDIPGFVGRYAHAHVAKRADGADLPPALFNYSPTTKSAIPAPPLVRYFGDGRRIRIMGITDPGVELVLDNAGNLARLLDPTARWRIERGSFSVRRRTEPQPYDLRSFVNDLPASRKGELTALLRSRAYDDPALTDFLKARLHAALIRQHETLGLPAPTTIAFDYFRVLNSIPIRAKGDRFFHASDILFAMPYELRGPWQFGSLQLRGYGQMQTVEPVEAMPTEEIA